MIRTFALIGGLLGATSVSQFPEYSQQYVQRLGGAVGALEQVVADFDASAQAEGLSRADALASMVGTDFVTRRRADMERTIDRYDTLKSDLLELETSGPFMRAYHASRVDSVIAKDTWAVFQPALPLNFAGAVFAIAGFLIGSFCVRLCFGAVMRLIPRRKALV